MELASYTWEVLARQLIMARKTIFDSRIKESKTRPRPAVVTNLPKAGFWPCAARFIYLLCPAKNVSWQASGLNKNTLIQEQPLAAKPVNPVTQTCPATSVTERGKRPPTSACQRAGTAEAGEWFMMAESIVCALFWYGLVGWCTAELHRRSGFTHVTAVPDTGSVGLLCSCAGL